MMIVEMNRQSTTPWLISSGSFRDISTGDGIVTREHPSRLQYLFCSSPRLNHFFRIH